MMNTPLGAPLRHCRSLLATAMGTTLKTRPGVLGVRQGRQQDEDDILKYASDIDGEATLPIVLLIVTPLLLVGVARVFLPLLQLLLRAVVRLAVVRLAGVLVVDGLALGQPVRQLAAARRPPRGEPLVASPTQKQGPGGQRLVERELGKPRAVSDRADPAVGPEALAAGRVLDDTVERDVLAHDDLSHSGSAPRRVSGNHRLAARLASPPCLAA